MILFDVVGNGIEQMGFAQSAFTVDQQRVIGIGRLGCYSPCSGMSKAVRGANHKVVKGELLIDGVKIPFVFILAAIFCQRFVI